MSRFGSAIRSPARRLLTVVCTLVVVSVVVLTVTTCRAQIPVDPDIVFAAVVFDGEDEVGRVYRDVAGPRYTEHWVLYPNYTFDQIREAGPSIEIVAVPGGYRGVSDFLKRVPFPAGSRYVIARCEEFDRLP